MQILNYEHIFKRHPYNVKLKKTFKKYCILGLEIKETVKEKVDDAGNKISEEWNKRVVSFQPELWLNVNFFMLGLGNISKTRVFVD